MQALTADQIKGSFVNCSRGEAQRATLPADLDKLDWTSLDFLGWRDAKAPGRAYLVIDGEPGPVGFALRSTTPPRSRIKSNLCGLCVTFADAASISLFSTRKAGAAGKQGNTVGIYACATLACSYYARRLRTPEVPQPAETLTVDQRVDRLRTKLAGFVRQALDES